ncbi:hypothetical protein ACS8E9_19485, partial [Pseudomonas neustonica]
MKTILKLLGCCLTLPVGLATADEPRQECLGRLTFDVPEEIEWATFNANRTMQISQGGGHDFSDMVAARGDNATYGEFGAVIYVSDEVERSMLCSGQLIPDSIISFSSATTGDIPPLN